MESKLDAVDEILSNRDKFAAKKGKDVLTNISKKREKESMNSMHLRAIRVQRRIETQNSRNGSRLD